MDAAQALADLTEISSQVRAAVLFAEGGEVLGSTLEAETATQAFVRGATELLEAAGAFRTDGASVTQLEASASEGSVFVVRDAGRAIVATTVPQPTAGLVFYDLKSCLRGAADPPSPRRRRRTAAQQKEEEKET